MTMLCNMQQAKAVSPRVSGLIRHRASPRRYFHVSLNLASALCSHDVAAVCLLLNSALDFFFFFDGNAVSTAFIHLRGNRNKAGKRIYRELGVGGGYTSKQFDRYRTV